MSDSPPWGDTPFSDFNFAQDCSLSGRYLASHLTGINEPSISVAARFFRAVAPDRPDLNESTALEWHQFLEHNDQWEHLGASAQFNQCLPDVCKSITRLLPNDVIGIGLLVALGIELALVVGYCAAALVPYARKAPPASGSGPLDRVLHAFYSTTGHFFNLAVLLCLGVSVAIIYDGSSTIASDAYAGASRPRTYYGAGGLLMGAIYFPLAATVPSYLWSSRRQWRDGVLAVTAWVFTSAAILLVPVGMVEGFIVRDVCPGEVVPAAVAGATGTALHGVATWCPALLAVILGITVTCFKCSGKRMWGWRPFRLVFRGLVVIYAVLGFVGTVSYAIMLFVFAGGSSWVGENWGLGQGIALVLWVPLLYELIHVAVVGIDRGLEERLPGEFHATRGSDVESEAELEIVPGSASGHPRRENATAREPPSEVSPRKLSVGSSTGGERRTYM